MLVQEWWRAQVSLVFITFWVGSNFTSPGLLKTTWPCLNASSGIRLSYFIPSPQPFVYLKNRVMSQSILFHFSSSILTINVGYNHPILLARNFASVQSIGRSNKWSEKTCQFFPPYNLQIKFNIYLYNLYYLPTSGTKLFLARKVHLKC